MYFRSIYLWYCKNLSKHFVFIFHLPACWIYQKNFYRLFMHSLEITSWVIYFCLCLYSFPLQRISMSIYIKWGFLRTLPLLISLIILLNAFKCISWYLQTLVVERWVIFNIYFKNRRLDETVIISCKYFTLE